jgi:hypothetical protein
VRSDMRFRAMELEEKIVAGRNDYCLIHVRLRYLSLTPKKLDGYDCDA